MGCYVVFAKNRQWWAFGSRILQWVEGTNFSHCGILVMTGNNAYVYESVFPRGRRVHYLEFLKKYEIVDLVSIDDNFEKNSHAYYTLLKSTSLPYSILQLLTIGLGILNKGLLERNKWLEVNGHKAAICTELVGNFLSAAYGVELGKSADLLGLQDIRILVDTFKEGQNVHDS